MTTLRHNRGPSIKKKHTFSELTVERNEQLQVFPLPNRPGINTKLLRRTQNFVFGFWKGGYGTNGSFTSKMKTMKCLVQATSAT